MSASPLEHMRKNSVNRVNGAEEIDVDHLFDGVGLKGSGLGIVPADPGICDEDVDMPELGTKFISGGVNAICVGYVGRKSSSLSAR